MDVDSEISWGTAKSQSCAGSKAVSGLNQSGHGASPVPLAMMQSTYSLYLHFPQTRVFLVEPVKISRLDMKKHSSSP